MRLPDLNIHELLPHASPMLLLDKVMSCSDDEVCTVVKINRDHPFAETLGVPSHIGLELMAQTCGVWAGLRSRKQSRSPEIGLLLGTRNYQCHVDFFDFLDQLTVTAKVVFLEDEMGVFDCQIFRHDHLLASASLSLFQPADSSLMTSMMADQR